MNESAAGTLIAKIDSQPINTKKPTNQNQVMNQ
jgi:hypothetical protein